MADARDVDVVGLSLRGEKMGDMIKTFPSAEAEPLFGPGAPKRKSTLLDGLRPEPVTYTVFLVEADTEARGPMLQTLQRSPFIHNVHWFNNGDAMLKHFVEEGYCSGRMFHNIPTIVLLNVSLPGTNGFEVLRRLKQNPMTAGIPVIMLADEPSEELAAEAVKLKASAFVVKPLSLSRVHEAMQTGGGW